MPAEANAARELSFGLSRIGVREVRLLLQRGRRVSVQFRGTATDAVGNRGPGTELDVRLVLE